MRFIQFNSGLCVVLKDVHQHPIEHPPSYYLAIPPIHPTHHSSNSSIATTSSSIKSNGSMGYDAYRSFVPLSDSSVARPRRDAPAKGAHRGNAAPSMMIIEVGISRDMLIKCISFPLARVYLCVRVRVIFARPIDT